MTVYGDFFASTSVISSVDDSGPLGVVSTNVSSTTRNLKLKTSQMKQTHQVNDPNLCLQWW